MTCEEVKLLWSDFLLGDLDEEQKAQVEEHLQTCSACQREFQEFKETLTVLKQWPDVEPARQLVFVPNVSRSGRSTRENWRQPVRWAAAFGVVILLVLGLTRTEFSYKNGRFQFAFGQSSSEKKSGELNWKPLLSQYAKETTATVSQLIQASEARQQKNLIWAVEKLNQQWYQQRQDDLRLIATGFQALKAENENRALQTNRLVQWLIQQKGNALPVHSQKLEWRKNENK